MTSYAATDPIGHLFAEGHAYRQAVEKPRRFIIVLGIWLIFGSLGLLGVGIMLGVFRPGIGPMIGGIFPMVISGMMIWKTTRNYLARPRTDQSPEA